LEVLEKEKTKRKEKSQRGKGKKSLKIFSPYIKE